MRRFIFLTFSLLVVALSLRGAKGYQCPLDWLPGNGLCYKVFGEPKTWNDAELFCRKLKPGCHLASIHSLADSFAVALYLTDYLKIQSRVWIGLWDPNQNFNWEWTDGSKTDYVRWDKDQPDHFENKEFCVEIVHYTGYLRWNDQKCTFLHSFLCQCKYYMTGLVYLGDPGDGGGLKLKTPDSSAWEGRKTMGQFISLTLGLLVVAFSLNGAKGCLCPRDWLPNNGFCYKVFDEHKNWNDAELFCRKHKPGCHLASIHSREESIDLAEYVSDYHGSGGDVWIGLNDPEKRRNWQWTDRSKNSYLMWKQGEPNNKENNENCVELWSPTGYKNWNDQNCASTRAYLCKCRF
ncbi:macrophage mannose receptor 1-like [Thamnophis elegans]|uniref:macrophage mannose receptor 1-like n=1 Tax=Thamnophis elegans TaxID=35005 RepID=UPI0013768AC0|nr:macrophage mannose receptor 1-like [Thamnophis elegans]